VRVKDLGIPHRTNEAIADRTKEIALADGKKRATKLGAEGKAYSTVLEGVSEGKKRADIGKGDAEAITSRAEAAKSEVGQLIVKLDALEKVAEGSKAIVLPSDLSILTAATAVKKVLDTIKGEEEQK